jgi:predicted ATPase
VHHAPSLMLALSNTLYVYNFCGNYTAGNAATNELTALATEKGASFWKVGAIWNQGWQLAVSGNTSAAVQMLATGLAGLRSTGITLLMPYFIALLANVYAELNQIDDASRCIDEAISTIEATKERWVEAEVNRIAGEIALLSPEPDAAKAETPFSSTRSMLRAHSKQSRGNSAPQ